MSKHTPGPWQVGGSLAGGCLPVNQAAAGDRLQVARVNGKAGEMEANARLTAAAPELLEALRKAVEVLRAHLAEGAPVEMCAFAEAECAMTDALRKAEGRS